MGDIRQPLAVVHEKHLLHALARLARRGQHAVDVFARWLQRNIFRKHHHIRQGLRVHQLRAGGNLAEHVFAQRLHLFANHPVRRIAGQAFAIELAGQCLFGRVCQGAIDAGAQALGQHLHDDFVVLLLGLR